MTEKKHYRTPEMKMHQVNTASIISTSNLQSTQTETYTDGNTIDDWN